MNRDQVEGAADKAVGKFKEKWGRLTGSPDEQAKGRLDQIKGEARKNRGRIKETLKNEES